MDGYYLSEAVKTKENNLNAVKLCAALLVIVSHAYGFAAGYEKTDWLNRLTGGTGDFGSLAVNVFFFYSGLLVSASLLRNGNAGRYLKRRAARIYPPFAVVTLLIVFVAAPFVTSLDFARYFTDINTYRYLENLLFITRHDLPGVFTENIYGTSVNGPIWTIRVEVFCYVMGYVFYRLGFLTKEKIKYALVCYLALAGIMGYGAYNGIEGLAAVIMPVAMYVLGMVYIVYANRLNLDLRLMSCALTGLLISFLLRGFLFGCVVFLPYILCCLAFALKKGGRIRGAFNAMGEWSYEIYLWGGFVGQMFAHMFGGSMSISLNMLLTVSASLVLGWATKRLVSRKSA